MTEPRVPPEDALTGLRVREPEQEARRARRNRIWARIVGTFAAAYLLLTIAAYFYAFHTVPRLPPPNRRPLQEPGGTLRQITSYEHVVLPHWSSDGTRLAFTWLAEDDWRMLAGTWAFMHFRALTPEWVPFRLWYLVVAAADGSGSQVLRLPDGLDSSDALWQPGTSVLAVEASRSRLENDDVQTEHGLWLFDSAHGRLGKRLYSGCCWPRSWSPDGISLLVQVAGETYWRKRFLALEAASGAATELPLPPEPRWIDSPCWSPDGHAIAFRCRYPRRLLGRHRDFPADSLWVVDVQAGRGRLVPTGPVGHLVWMSDGRLIVTRSEPTREGKVATLVGAVNLDATRVEWFPWTLRYPCARIEEAQGRVVVALAYHPRASHRAQESDLWELSLRDGALRRLTQLGETPLWVLSPRGDRIAFGGTEHSMTPGLWVLDIAGSAALAAVKR